MRALVVGAGLFGATCAAVLRRRGWRVTVLERREHVAGNCYDEVIDGQRACRYGAHIFHTNSAAVWDFLQPFADWRQVAHRKYARVDGKLYAFPISLMTLYQLWGVTTPDEAAAELERRRAPQAEPTRSVETWCLHTVGPELYERFVKGYTEKMWGRPCAELPHTIVARVPVRLSYDDRYFSDRWEAVPAAGYTALVGAMLEGCDVHLGVDYLQQRAAWDARHDLTVFSGPLDAFYGYRYGALAYRSLAFSWAWVAGRGQGALTVNYPGHDDDRLRSEEYAHLWPHDAPRVLRCDTRPLAHAPGADALYPVRDAESMARLAQYAALAATDRAVIGGRLGQYQYLNIDQVVAAALRRMEAVCA